MLSYLNVRHLAVVDDLEIDFSSGMTSLTGETGAGKSILVDALGLVLGDRADSNMIRHGHERAEIEAHFDIQLNPNLQTWLVEQELDDDGQCYLRRTISRDSASRGYINGRSVPLAQLRIISEHSIDIHGQHAHQSLVRADTQRLLLDTVAGTKPLLNELTDAYKLWQTIKHDIDEQAQQSAQTAAQLDLLQYQVNELSPLNLTEEHVHSLISDQQKLAHASQLMSAAQSGLHQLTEQEQGSAYSIVSQTLSELTELADIEPQFTNIIEALNSTVVQIDESASELRHYLDSAELDPQLLDDIENELTTLHQLARKHHVEIEALPSHYTTLCEQLAQLAEQDKQKETLQAQLLEQETLCLTLCEKIRKQRHKAAAPLAKEITRTIQQLAIPSGRLEFVVSPMPKNHFNETGFDRIQLLVSTNPGQSAGELGKVASGGELARISLAIQVVTAGTRSVPTLVFDEVDVGIGGGIAEIVGQHLRALAKTQQVICITHLPQVASQAHQQVQVAKKQLKESTFIELITLTETQRIEEIARMLGGVTITKTTRSHAQEMLGQPD
jgi:DNA repair protein RecN (Recombination protein N)